MSEIIYQDAKIYFETSGEGDKVPLVLLHGFLEDSEIWKNIVADLKKERQVICIDLPGHGKSDGISKEHSMHLMANVVREVLKSLNLQSVSMAGHSMGGYVSLEFLKNFPNLLKSIMLINSTPVEDTVEKKKIRERSIDLVSKNKDAFVSMAISNLFSEQSKHVFDSEIKNLKARALRIKAENVQAALIGMKNRTNYENVLRKFENQKMIAAGFEDPILNFTEVRRVSESCNCNFYEMKNGHNSWMEDEQNLIKIMHFID